MDHKIFKIALLLCCGLLAACSKSDDVSTDPTADVLTSVNTSPTPAIPVWETKEVREGPHGTEIVLTRDESGNYVETRNFKDHPLIDRFVIVTLVDKSKVGFCYSKNGEKIPLTDSQIALALSATGDDLAQSVSLAKPKEPPSDQPPLVAHSNEANSLAEPALTAPVDDESAEPKRVQIADSERLDREALKRSGDERVRRLQREITSLPPARGRN